MFLRRRLLLLLACAAPFPGIAQDSAPTVPGLSERHPLDSEGVGRLLLDELRCGACHEGIAPDITPAPAPDLNDLARRVAPDYVQRFLMDPSRTRPGTKMPHTLDALPPEQRAVVAETITHFLFDRSLQTQPADEPKRLDVEADATEGEDLFHTVGCVACHAPRRSAFEGDTPPTAGPGDVGLDHVASKYRAGALAAFLFQPQATRPSGRMPDMGLTRAEAASIATYLAGVKKEEKKLEVRPELVETGREHFEAFGCAACHDLDGVSPPRPVTTAQELDPSAGCLAEDVAGAPRYTLDASQRQAIQSALAAKETALTDEDRIAHTLTAFNCIACHVRDDYGGVRPEIDAYFTTNEHELGDDARIPPPLTLTGAKLQRAWMHKVLFGSGHVRPYMFTRMPQFGEANLAHLPELVERVDVPNVPPFEMPTPQGEEGRMARDAGRELLGITVLSCVACHDFNGKPSLTHEGVDLINSTERLRPEWFAHFLIDPQTYRPGVVMPESWSGGVASQQKILGGDTNAQIRAIWHFLAQGRTARTPDGLKPTPSHLTVEDEVRTYRGRSRVAGYRGIAVGHPGGWNFAFNAQTGTLSALWRGDFVSVRWDSQGAGDFNPAARAVQLAQDVSFFRLPDEDTPWPLRPKMDDENPVNPDPLYPRNVGYRFRGYELDEADVPTFLYESGTTRIRDRSEVVDTGERSVLRRTLRFASETEDTLFFRALTGDFEEVGEREYRAQKLWVALPDAPILNRPHAADDTARELLLELQLPAGESHVTIDYELRD